MQKYTLLFRVNIIFFLVFLLFSLLILRLGMVQIIHGEDYKRELERTSVITVKNPVPRGRMFDRDGKIIVNNVPKYAITYTNYGASQKEMLEVAERLAKLIDIRTDKVQERDKKDYWLMKNPDRATELVSPEEKKLLREKLDTNDYNREVYRLQLERMSDKELKELTEDDLKVLAIYRAFRSGAALTPQIVKNEDVTQEEFALVSENLAYLPGVDTTTDWERTYTFGHTLRTVLGNVTTADEGIPRENMNYYLSRGYTLNDRVGKSYIEKEYEDVLQGRKTQVSQLSDQHKNIIRTEVVSEGERGKDLVLTIDMDLQMEVEKIIEDELIKAKKEVNSDLLDRAFVVVMDPYNGDILTMAGKQMAKDKETGKQIFHDFALGNITTSYSVGSAVKGATLYTGYSYGVIKPGTVFYDAPLKIWQTPEMGSWKKLGYVNDIRALRVSSNVYMFHTAIKLGEGIYRYNKPLPLKVEAFDKMRESFSQFGLGVRTGIDLPNETAGFQGPDTSPGLLLFLSIGQYDTYTTMQLAQYVSTIANGGYRIKPRIVKAIYRSEGEGNELGPLILDKKPEILNRVPFEKKWLKNIREGFRQVIQHREGTGYKYFKDVTYSPAGKTGTAQAFYDGPLRKNFKSPPEVMNLSFVGYAPYHQPEIAIAVVVPWAYQGDKGYAANMYIARRVMDAYFSLKKKK